MIYYNLNTINDWNFGDDNIIKVYKHGAVVFYKFDSEQGGYKVCYAVVDDITQYSDREYEDVYDKATEKWYKLNNLNQYEEYGIYGSGRSVTTYNGKLTIDNGYEYEWNGSSWVNLGEVSGSSKSSDFKIGDIDSPITSDASLITDGMFGIILPVSLSANTSSASALIGSSDSNTLSNLSSHTKTEIISENDIIDYAVWKFHGTATANTFYMENVATNKYFGYSNVDIDYMPLVDESSKVPTVFSAFTHSNVTALGICKGDTPYQYYAINDLYAYHYQYNWFNPLSSAGDLNNSYVIYKLKGSDAEYPKYYAEKSEPLDSLTFNTLEEAQAYAEANCVYVGLKATIDGDKYVFSGDSQSGYEWVEQSYSKYEYIRTVRTGSGNSYYTIDTGFYPTTANTIEVKFEMVDRSVDWGNIVSWGVLGNTAHSTSLQFATVTTRYQAIVRTGGNNGAAYRPTIGANNSTVYTLPLSATSGTYSVNGGPTNTIRYNINSSFNLPSIVSMRILGGYGNDNGDIKNYKSAVGKLYYVKVYDGNGNIVKHYIPSDNNGTPCFYEIVDGEYIMDTYTGSNHGTLTLGPQV